MGTVAAATAHKSTLLPIRSCKPLAAAQCPAAGKKFLGLHFEMKAGGKFIGVRWRCWFPPQIRWDASQSIKNLDLMAHPKEVSVLGLSTLGYEEEVVLPIAVSLQQKRQCQLGLIFHI